MLLLLFTIQQTVEFQCILTRSHVFIFLGIGILALAVIQLFDISEEQVYMFLQVRTIITNSEAGIYLSFLLAEHLAGSPRQRFMFDSQIQSHWLVLLKNRTRSLLLLELQNLDFQKGEKSLYAA